MRQSQRRPPGEFWRIWSRLDFKKNVAFFDRSEEREQEPGFVLRATPGIPIHVADRNGGAEEVRTPDPHVANVVLSQLSYRPICQVI